MVNGYLFFDHFDCNKDFFSKSRLKKRKRRRKNKIQWINEKAFFSKIVKDFVRQNSVHLQQGDVKHKYEMKKHKNKNFKYGKQ